jgi:hypothetical protein
MNDLIESAKEAIIESASNPKVAVFAGGGTASVGIAAQMDIITGYVARISVWLGALTTAVVLAIQILKLVRDWRHYRREESAKETP